MVDRCGVRGSRYCGPLYHYLCSGLPGGVPTLVQDEEGGGDHVDGPPR